MQLPLKKTALASVLALSLALPFATSAVAATDIGAVSSLSVFGATPTLGAFDDLYNFTVSPNSGAVVSATTFTFGVGGTTMNTLALYAGTFANVLDLAGQVALPTTVVLSQSAGSMFTAFTMMVDHAALTAPSYTLRVAGTSSVLALPYTGFVSLAPPVPEPETYALVLAGLGMMGVIIRRRKSS